MIRCGSSAGTTTTSSSRTLGSTPIISSPAFVVAFLLDEPERVADDVQCVRVGDAVFRVMLACGFNKLHTVKDGLTRG